MSVESSYTKGDVLSPQEQSVGGMNGILLQVFSFLPLYRTKVRVKNNELYRKKEHCNLRMEVKIMSNVMTVWTKKEVDEWREIMNSDPSIKRFEVKNLSDYSGEEYEIGYDYN